MKKIIGFLILSTLLSCSNHAKTGVVFKLKYKPETKYIQSMDITSNVTMNYSGSAEFLQRLKDNGVGNPVLKKTESKIEATFKTGKLSDGTHFPVIVEFTSWRSSDSTQVIPNGTIIYGQGTLDSMPKLDSISSAGMSDDFKHTLLKTFQTTLSQITFPDKNLNVGDTFSHSVPLSIPIASTSIDMAIKTTYKLTAITNGIANFDISQVYSVKLTPNTMEGKGNGNGQIQYDIANNVYLNYHETSSFTCKMKFDEIGIDLSSTSNYVQKTTLSPN